ncbi:hypothetical protein ACTWQF_09240 [Streptomyces sp. 8N114]|uniref:hypothetical protein n=1 Tax=Streptomyces sp. 8N114 TaxID=3457419 RepID=UPI003FCF096B
MEPEEHLPGSAIERSALLGAVISASHLSSLEELLRQLSAQAARVGLTDVVIYLVDLQQELLTPLTAHPPRPETTACGRRRSEWREPLRGVLSAR